MIIKGGDKILSGELEVIGDKSISHRAIILLSLAEGRSSIRNILYSEDIKRTINIYRQLGINIDSKDGKVIIEGKGLYGLSKANRWLNCGNSGTTMRLMTGVLAGQNFDSVLVGDGSLNRRPMKRVIDPIRKMGGSIIGENGYPPLFIRGKRKLKKFDDKIEVASAQVKSSILLAGLYTEDDILIEEASISRNHTENMLEYLGMNIKKSDKKIKMVGRRKIEARDIYIPGDISSAAYFIVAGTIIEGSNIKLKDIGLNETRSGILDAIFAMGGNIEISNRRYVNNETLADLSVKSSSLKAIEIEAQDIGRIIDEIPILAVAAAFARGTTIIRGVSELRIKETDRLTAIIRELSKSGIKIWSEDDDLYIEGGEDYSPARFKSYGDHRLAMTFSILALACKGKSKIEDVECVNISYPNFYRDLSLLIKQKI